jgi:fluoride exporter
MKDFLLVGLGGFAGSIARYALSGIVLHQAAGARFPFGTFIVNVAGCLAIGLLAGLVESRGLFSFHVRLFLLTGVLGGFTTFSAFGFESLALARRGELAVAALYVVLSVVVGLAAVWLGMRLLGSNRGL